MACSGQVSWRAVPSVVLAIVASGCIFMACGIAFFSLAFWLGKMDGLARQLWDLVITFSLYPEPLFGSALRVALFTVLPAGLVGWVPARLAHDPSIADAFTLSAAAGLYLVFAAIVFERGLRRYGSGNRFSTFG
jgi:ABC-2 type transport system permease protein